MVKPNWDIFKAKFSDNPQSNFEWFCYLLFCKQFNKEYGIFRYKNQSAIETNPIKVNDDVVAWQAKFYETPLSKHKKDFENTLNNLKRDYPNVNKLQIYSNKEWSQAKGHKPQGLKDIEKLAEKLDIKLKWKLASFFESEFVTEKNDIISKHFFTFEKSIYIILKEMDKHSKNLLKNVCIDISFKDKKFEIKREHEMNQLINNSNQVSIISGMSGVGKTVLVKKIYERYEEDIPIYIFKATEFEIRNINDIFDNFNLSDFLAVHKDLKNKIIVIDSAEKLLDLRDTDPFKELLSAVVEDNWKVIFTSRDTYLKDLNYQFFEIYKVAPLNIGINPLSQNELITISSDNNFTLPLDKNLIELIKNPFYLNEYLKFYNDINDINYVEFKSKLWEQRIKKSKPKREKCFLDIALQRANTGQFFVDVKSELENQCEDLMQDGMLGYENMGYFISHDIYEEWALEKIINKEFINRSDELSFFTSIGESLPIRRCLRNWISEKLLLKDYKIVEFIEDTIKNNEIQPFWKDELFASILLSDYSRIFFKVFKDELLSNKFSLLKRLTIILRITCKEVDNEFLKQLGIKDIDIFSLQYILTKPKGIGWEALIEFTLNNIEKIGIENINFILPVINDWNNINRKGNTTRCAGLIALQYYQYTISNDLYYPRDDTLETVFKTIINGSSELKVELKEIIAEILCKEWKNHRDPYYDFAKFVLTQFDGLHISRVLPDDILELADFYWTYIPKQNNLYSDWRDDIEQEFGIEKWGLDYYPASAYQSPIYSMLQAKPEATIDFILNFTNKSIKKYVSSDRAARWDNITEIEINLKNDIHKKQYISQSLWEIYRGISSPVIPNLLQSLHMALEKFLLKVAEKEDTEVLVNLLNYLLKNTVSASISSVVTSITLAYPEKTFDIARILFRTREFIINDTHRLFSEEKAKTLYSIGKNRGVSRKNIYTKERIQTCKDKHRNSSLESLCLNYQVFAIKESGEEAKKRQEIIWGILDDYYKELLPDSKQRESDKTWRLFLARMDRRKMNINTKMVNEGILIEFEPEIAPDISEFSEENQKNQNEYMRYQNLKLWADLKNKNEDKSSDYEKYDSNPQNSLEDVKEILKKINELSNPIFSEERHSEDDIFYMLNNGIPSCVCAALVEHYIDKLNFEDKTFCKDVLIETIISSVKPNYTYQIDDGVQEAIASLPKLMKLYKNEKENIKLLILLTLFKDESVGGLMSNEKFDVFPIEVINKMWREKFEDAHSLLLGYLLFKHKYNELLNKIQRRSYEKENYESYYFEELNKFIEENEINFKKMIDCNLSFSEIENIQELDLSILSNALKMMPIKLEYEEHINIAREIIAIFAKELMQDRYDHKVDFMVRKDFMKRYAYIVLNAKKSDVIQLLKPFIDGFKLTEPLAELFQEFIYAEDRIQSYYNFWLVWDQFKNKIIESINNKNNDQYIDNIIQSYLFAKTQWKDYTNEWSSLKRTNLRLIKDVSEQIGQNPAVLYSISKMLNDIGSWFIGDGLMWISNMLSKHSEYETINLDVNTSLYLENAVRKYVYIEHEKIKKNKRLKKNILVVLNFLIRKNSNVAFILRENII